MIIVIRLIKLSAQEKKKKDPPITVGKKGWIMQPYNSIIKKIKQQLPTPLWDSEGSDYATLPA